MSSAPRASVKDGAIAVFDYDDTLTQEGRVRKDLAATLERLAGHDVLLVIASSGTLKHISSGLSDSDVDPALFAVVVGRDARRVPELGVHSKPTESAHDYLIVDKGDLLLSALGDAHRLLGNGVYRIASIGDSVTEMTAAAENHITAIGVDWAGAKRKGLLQGGAETVVHSPDELQIALTAWRTSGRRVQLTANQWNEAVLCPVVPAATRGQTSALEL